MARLETKVPQSPKVLSVPAGKSYGLILKHLIYSCPEAYTYKNTPLITFRTTPPDAIMEKVFAIQKVERADPSKIEETCAASDPIKKRITAYVAAAGPAGILAKSGYYRFYILAPDDVVQLVPAPKAAYTQQGPIYFSLAELQSGKEIVEPLRSLTYKEKLLDERWIQKRTRIVKERGAVCALCGSSFDLDVHHGYYSFVLEPWEYNDASLWVLCRVCHTKTQHLLTSIHMAIGFTHPAKLEWLKARIADAAFEAQIGISTAEAEEILREEELIQATLYSEYSAEITASADLGPSIASQLGELAIRAFPGVEISINQRESDVDGNVYVSGPDPVIVERIQAFLDRERVKMG